jgi:hypothetical protein
MVMDKENGHAGFAGNILRGHNITHNAGIVLFN